jgi:Zinc finger, C2H2 type
MKYQSRGEQTVENVPFVDTNQLGDETEILNSNFQGLTRSESRKTKLKITEHTFDGNWSSNEKDDDDDNALLEEKKRKSKKKSDRHSFWKHKSMSLAGKIACKYCDTVFISRDSLKMHACKYLSCDPKNFICRICDKELSKSTFSNHLHETLDCQYCGKKFVNPRNMKAHIKKQHPGQKFLQPERNDGNSQLLPFPPRPKPKKYKKKEKLECGKKSLLKNA